MPATIPHPPVTVPTIVPSPYTDPGFLAQIVRAVIESMSHLSAPAAPVPQTTPVATTSTDSVVALVRTVKSMREMGCEFFFGEADAEVAVRWLRKVEDTLEEIQVAQELRVRCATQLLSDRAHSWWDIVRSRRPIGSWTWAEFRARFESQYYSSQHQRIKAQEFLTLTQGDMAVLEYERRFHDLSMFAPYIVPTEQHWIQKNARWITIGFETGIDPSQI
jgi:hypothetical protein